MPLSKSGLPRITLSKRSMVLCGVLAFALGSWLVMWLSYPSDTTPEGAYYRVAKSVSRDEPAGFFAYLETAAQHACFSIGDYRAKAKQRVMQSFPNSEQQRALVDLEPYASHPQGPDVFALAARERGWLMRLKQDLSGVDHVEREQERATVQTVRGTRYSFRRRENGIWGLTQFTAFLVEEAERAARDYEMLRNAALDYDRKAGRAIDRPQ